jgi:glycosyltransferase 2 family protein
VLLLALALPAIRIQDLGAHLARLGPGLLAAVLGLSLANYALRSLRWQLLSRAAGLRVPLGRNSLYYVAGFAFAVTPGKAGEVVRLWLLHRHHGTPYERSVGLLLVDRLTDALPLLIFCLPALGRFAGQAWGAAAAGLLLLAALGLLLRPDWLAGLVRLVYARVRHNPRLFARMLRSLRPLRTIAAPRVLAPALGLGLLGWFAEIVGAWLVLGALGTGTGLAATAFVFAFAMLIGAVPIFPGGVGGAEGTMVGLLLLVGVDAGAAVTATAIVRLATLGFALVLGFAALPVAVRRPREPARWGRPPLAHTRSRRPRA